MKAVYTNLEYVDSDRIYRLSESIDESLQIDIYVQIYSEKFIEYQKEIIEDFAADFVDQMRNPELMYRDIQDIMEKRLQQLNEKLKSFAEKLRDMPSLELKGYIQVLADQALITTMIGNTSLVIFRDERVYYTLVNDAERNDLIDLFSDIVEGEVQIWDSIVYAGVRVKDVLDQQDIEELEHALVHHGVDSMMAHFSELLSTRLAEEQVGFLAAYAINMLQISQRFTNAKSYVSQFSSKLKLDQASKKAKTFFSSNRYYTMIAVLVALILFLVYTVSSQLGLVNTQSVSYVTQEGKTIDLTVNDIRKDIYAFQTLDPSSNEKSVRYGEIISKLATLERNGKRLEDVQALRKLLDDAYNQGFHIISVSSLKDFDDPINGTTTRTLTFNNSEKSTLGIPLSVQVWEGVHIGGTKGGIIWSINESNRGSLLEFNMGSDVEDCALNLSSRGLFCYTNLGAIFNVTKSAVENMETAAGDRSTRDIGGLGTYAKTNLYVFQKTANNFAGVVMTRYRNIPGSEMNYQAGQNYSLVTTTGMTVPATFNGFTIDGNFLAWGDGKLYQLFRTSNASTLLDMREVELRWGDQVSSVYSDQVKVLASQSSPYVYLFDKKNQTFTVYDSSPVKTHENYGKTFNLYYLFRFKFDLGLASDGNKLQVVDVAVPSDAGLIPELYLLTSEWVNKIKLHEFIDSLKNNKNLKTVNDMS